MEGVAGLSHATPPRAGRAEAGDSRVAPPRPRSEGWLYPAVRWVSRRALRWCFREVHITGAEQLPAAGPVLLVGNHPNDVPDVLLGYFTTPRRVRYVATISMIVSPIARATYAGLAVIPIVRVRDARRMRERGVDLAAVNSAALRRVGETLHRGDVVGIFPEGGVQSLPHLGSIKQGVARMILQAFHDHDLPALTVVPFGCQYEAPATVRSDVIVRIGAPVRLTASDWLGRPDAVAGVTTLVREALLGVTRNSTSWAAADARDRAAAAMAALLTTSQGPGGPRLLAIASEVHVVVGSWWREREQPTTEEPGSAPPVPADAGPRAVRPTKATLDEPLERWHLTAERMADAVDEAGGIATSARDHARVLHAAGMSGVDAAWPSRVAWSLQAPVALLGGVMCAPLFLAIRHLAHRRTASDSEPLPRHIIPGVYLALMWPLLVAISMALAVPTLGGSAWWGLVALVALPRLGDLFLHWHDALGAWRLRRRVRRWSPARRQALMTDAASLRADWPAMQATAASHFRLIPSA